MAEINRSKLFGKLNSVGYKAIESATVFCKLRGNPYVEVVHWFHQIMALQDSDLRRIIRHFELNPSRLASDMTAALDRLPTGATSISDLSSHMDSAVERAWTYSSLLYGDSSVRTGHLVVALLKSPELKGILPAMSGEFAKIKADRLTDDFNKIVAGSPEDNLRATDGYEGGGSAAPGEESGAMAPAQMGKQEALKRFTTDLTEQARSGKMDPIVGRDMEIRQIIDILMRRRQNNPILTGEAGVGKTAAVEGFAQRIAKGDVPPMLKDVSVRTLDLGLLQAGASMKGEFENRLRQVIDEVQSSPKPIILFIDEAHTLIGAGGQAGTGDAANLLKPALARGTLRTIAATTWAEYKKYFEKDPALTRRFQVVQIDEPSEEKAILMMRGIASSLEGHHKVMLLDEAIEAAVRLSHRYIPARQLPDKSVSLLDTACARVAVSQHATPAELEDTEKLILALKTEMRILDREQNVGLDRSERQGVVTKSLEEAEARRTDLVARWDAERTLVASILEMRAALREGNQPVDDPNAIVAAPAHSTPAPAEGAPPAPAAKDAAAAPAAPEPLTGEARTAKLAELSEALAKLAELQGETPLILPAVDGTAVASVVADWTGIPVGRMVRNQIEAVLKLADNMNNRVIGQRHGLEAIARRIQTSRAGLDNPNRPIGVFMLVGPSGVGKTETALTLAESLYGGEQNVITINMSEFQEAHTVSTLKGAPPGYVGYGEGGILTEAVRRRPYSVVLLDEVEKAHPDVHEIFFQVFDKGRMEDGEGRMIDFKNTVILLTSNVGSDLIMNMCSDPELLPEPDAIADSLRDELLKTFPAALLGRLVVVPYYPISPDMLTMIIKLQLRRIETRLLENHGVVFGYDDAALALIAARCTELASGGRMVDAILTHTLLPTISREFLTRMMAGDKIARVTMSVADEEFTYTFE